VPGFSGSLLRYKPNRLCKWQNFELACMVHARAPLGKSTKAALRHFNYVVAELSDSRALSMAKRLGVPVIEANGCRVVNLEIACFERQGRANPRRAKLL